MLIFSLNVFRTVLLGFGLLVSAFTLGSLMGRLNWLLDLLSHFHLQYLLLLLVSLLGLIVMREQNRRWLLLVPAFVINAFLIVPFFVPEVDSPAGSNQAPLRVLSMNISTSDAGYPQIISLIRQRQPDIVFMSEVRPDLVALLQEELADQYPVQYVEPSRFTLGVAILARDPRVSVQTVSIDADIGRMRRRFLRADFAWEGTPVTLAGIHPLPPLRGEWAYGRNREIGVMAELAQEMPHPFILVGDLNASPWSQAMRALVADTDLRYANDGYGIWPTWFVGSGTWRLMSGAPLDHILVSPQWHVVQYTESGDIGSDHVPLQVDLVLN